MSDCNFQILGVFSIQTSITTGFGETRKKSESTTLYFAEEQENEEIILQPINNNYVPSGDKTSVPKDIFLKNYLPEPQIYFEKVQPAMRELNKTIARGERHRNQKEYFSAEYEFQKALKIDENNIRATFNLGLTYLDRQDREKGDIVFKRLVQLKEPFEKKHKHMFNEFGISLRENQMLKQALQFYGKAYKLEKKRTPSYL